MTEEGEGELSVSGLYLVWKGFHGENVEILTTFA